MNIRRERVHHSGLTNLDFRTKGDLSQVEHYQPTLKFSDFGTMTKTQYKRVPSASTFKEQVAISGGWLNSKFKNDFYRHSRYETANQQYVQQGKKQKAPTLISGKATQLEASKWTDKVFTGDNAKNAAALTFYARQREMSHNEGTKGRQTTVD